MTLVGVRLGPFTKRLLPPTRLGLLALLLHWVLLGCTATGQQQDQPDEPAFYVRLDSDLVAMREKIALELSQVQGVYSVEVWTDPMKFPVLIYGAAVPRTFALKLAETVGKLAGIEPEAFRIEPSGEEFSTALVWIDLPSPGLRREHAEEQAAARRAEQAQASRARKPQARRISRWRNGVQAQASSSKVPTTSSPQAMPPKEPDKSPLPPNAQR